ncbi:threonine/serine exporter family protein [Streptomyces sp. NPDC085942]|uniref:threonine/serine exporter family protein n=1 Tax=Streptomyces sp. NPDC085942 TaxID=3365743 RepID=UPI0037D0A882
MSFRTRRGADGEPVTVRNVEASATAREFLQDAAVAQADAGVPSFHVTTRMQQIAAALGLPGARVYTMPAGVLVHQADGTTAFFDADNSTAGTGSLRMDQLQELQSLLDDVAAGRTGADADLRRLKAMKSAPPCYTTATVLTGHALFGLEFGMRLKPTWWGLVLAVALAVVVGGVNTLAVRNRAGAALMSCAGQGPGQRQGPTPREFGDRNHARPEPVVPVLCAPTAGRGRGPNPSPSGHAEWRSALSGPYRRSRASA